MMAMTDNAIYNHASQVTYRLTAADELETDFRAETDQPTPVALTNHAYWNLSGDLRRPVYDHVLRVAASRYLALGEHQVTTRWRSFLPFYASSLERRLIHPAIWLF